MNVLNPNKQTTIATLQQRCSQRAIARDSAGIDRRQRTADLAANRQRLQRICDTLF